MFKINAKLISVSDIKKALSLVFSEREQILLSKLFTAQNGYSKAELESVLVHASVEQMAQLRTYVHSSMEVLKPNERYTVEKLYALYGEKGRTVKLIAMDLELSEDSVKSLDRVSIRHMKTTTSWRLAKKMIDEVAVYHGI